MSQDGKAPVVPARTMESGVTARPTEVPDDDEDTALTIAGDVTGMIRLPRRRVARPGTLVARVVAGCDDLTYVRFPVGRPLLVGRDSVCDLAVPHASVSRKHATIALDDDNGLRVTDLGSTNGTWIGVTQVVAPTTCALGERIGIGHTTVRVERLIDEELAQLDRVAQKVFQSGVDPLTGLLTRAWLQEHLPSVVADHQRAGMSLTVVFVDLDHFKAVNDTFGHAVGDAVLRVAAQVIRSGTRKSDVAVRYGGEEFLLILPRIPIANGVLVADRMRAAFADVEWSQHGVVDRRLTLSCGLAQLRPGEDVASWFHRADQALYEAKGRGRNVTAWAR